MHHNDLSLLDTKGQLTYALHEVLSIRGQIKPLENGHGDEANTSSSRRGSEVGEWR
jgi:hypothetical protein